MNRGKPSDYPTTRETRAILRAARIAHGLTQREVAARGGYAQGNLKHWEGDRSNPTLVGLFDWAGALGFSVRLVPVGSAQYPLNDLCAAHELIAEQRAEIERLRAAVLQAWGHLEGVK